MSDVISLNNDLSPMTSNRAIKQKAKKLKDRRKIRIKRKFYV